MYIKEKIDKAEVSEMEVETFPGRIIVIQTELEAEKAVNFLLTQPMVGVDTETRPSFKRGTMNKVALLQVSTSDTCFLFRLNMIGMCAPVERLLSHPTLVKVGLSLKDDIRMLHQVGEFASNNFIDLQDVVGQVGIRDMSLQKIYANLFGRKISKRQRLTNWEADVLNDAQKSYAAIDAWACLKIFDRIEELKKSGNYEVIPAPVVEEDRGDN
ncbi:MAG: 3'-5' exonuclease domain-containing protein 2 [Bacteroidaceae bacterium]|nr:3'-5' exonuclease domain-containing protein 2 [Bacteroidaceae bacterium]